MRLRAIGVRISVDDFGTGYSSLAYLRQFPIDGLKIDRSFVRGMVTNKDTAEIVAGVMNLSKQLGLYVVAEGIEHEDQCAHLRALNCHAGQGNLFATALDVESATEVLKIGLAPRRERRRDTTTLLGRETSVPQLLVRGHRLMTGHRVSLAVTALALLSLLGLLTVFDRIQSAVGGAGGACDGPEAALDRGDSSGADSPDCSFATSEWIFAAVTITIIIIIIITITAAPPAAIALSDVVGGRPSAPPRQLPWRLNLTRDGVAFVSEENDADAFTLKFAEFLHALSDDTLTLMSATKTYRFKAREPRDTTQLRELADRMSHPSRR
jgi:hypothetical protein